MTKDSLVKGTIILTIAAFVARFLGLMQKVPLQRALDDTGMATFGIAYNIYFALLIVATAGIPSALSKMTSERYALGNYDEAGKIFKAAVIFSLVAGVIVTILLFIIAPYYATYISKDADASLAIRALAPALLLFPLIAIMRGYFQGRQMMMANGISQIIEQILRVVTAVGLAYLLIYLDWGHAWAAAGASFGGVMGSIGAAAVMLYFYKHLKSRDQFDLDWKLKNKQTKTTMNFRAIYREIFRLSIPISLISLGVPLIYLIDSSITIWLLEGQLGFEEAKRTLGILIGRAQSLAGIPPILAIALSQSIVPIISAAYAKRDVREMSKQTTLTLRISLLSGLPMVLLLMIAARPINAFLFKDALGTGIVIWLIAGSIFQIMMMTSAAVLMGLGHTKAPLKYVFIGIGVKLVGSYIFAIPFGIYGILLATTLCFATIMALNIRQLRHYVSFKILGNKWFGLVISVFAILLFGYMAEYLLFQYANVFSEFGMFNINKLIHASLLAMIVIILYVLLLAVTKVVTKADVDNFPQSVQKLILKVAKVLKLQNKLK